MARAHEPGFAEKIGGAGALVAGVLSGTSGDGIDVALVRIVRAGGHAGASADSGLAAPELLAFETAPFPPDLARSVRAVLDGEPLDLRGTALLARDLGRAFGRAAREAAERSGRALDLVGSHGQTVWHHDGRESSGPATLQLGDGDFVAEEARCAAVSDFRQRDVAAGGEGAPIAALVDDLLFAREPRPAAILNLGGIGNLTLLGRGGELASFDTGPANALLDGLSRRLLGRSFDEGGAQALRGRADRAFADALCDHAFFDRNPPKSTGRDTFGETWVEDVLRRWTSRSGGAGSMRAEDCLATAAHFVARTVALAIERFVPEAPLRLLVAGGGAHNRAVLAALGELCPVPVAASDAAGVDPDAREALAFAVLAARCALGIPSTSTSATGARAGRVLGKISPR